MRFHAVFPVQDYDLSATLASGQAFRWQLRDGWWEGIIGTRWVRLRDMGNAIIAEMVEPVPDWDWLKNYLQLEIDLSRIVETFPQDEPMQRSVEACRGLRLLRQEPWECLASFILSSTKQIVQIQQIVAALCEKFGQPLLVPPEHAAIYSFPTAERLPACADSELRNCNMAFRAHNLFH